MQHTLAFMEQPKTQFSLATLEQLLSLDLQAMLKMSDTELEQSLGPILQEQEQVLSKLPARAGVGVKVNLKMQTVNNPATKALVDEAMKQAGLTPEALRALGIKI